MTAKQLLEPAALEKPVVREKVAKQLDDTTQIKIDLVTQKSTINNRQLNVEVLQPTAPSTLKAKTLENREPEIEFNEPEHAAPPKQITATSKDSRKLTILPKQKIFKEDISNSHFASANNFTINGDDPFQSANDFGSILVQNQEEKKVCVLVNYY